MTSGSPRAEILVVEDDHSTRYLCETALTVEGYSVLSVENGKSAADYLAAGRFDLVILDLGLPDIDGVELANELQDKQQPPPILVMSSRSTPEQRVIGFDLGVADYLTKPFHPVELLHRVQRILSQRSIAPISEQATGAWRLMLPEAILLGRDDQRVKLTRGEANLISVLMRAEGRVVSRERLLQAVSRTDSSNPKTVDVLVSRLRRKLEEGLSSSGCIKAVSGIGYRLVVS